MTIAKAGFFILIISIVFLSEASQQKELQIEKDLSLHLALRLGKMKIEDNQAIYPHYDDEKKNYLLEINDLQRWFLREPLLYNELFFSKQEYLEAFSFNGGKWIKSVKELNSYIDVLEKRKKEIVKMKSKKKGFWEGFWKNAEQEIKKAMENAQLTQNYLQHKADQEREKIFQDMSERIIKNWEGLSKSAFTYNREKVLRLLQSPLELSQLPELVAFKKSSVSKITF